MAQLVELHEKYDELQYIHGEPTLRSIYGAGEINCPNYCFVFMNPTGRNVSAKSSWKGLRAPWIGTKQVWKLFFELDLLSGENYAEIKSRKPDNWNEKFAEHIYENLESNSVFVTNLAKCTQLDARPLKDAVFKEYRDLLLKEITNINPKVVITFGNQVSSIILQKPITVSKYATSEFELLRVTPKRVVKVFPTYYPVGQGARNLPLAIERIRAI